MNDDISIQYDANERGFLISLTVKEEMRVDSLADEAGRVERAALDIGKRLLDEHSFLTISARLRVYVLARSNDCLELYCRLPLADTDEALDTRSDELSRALAYLRIGKV